MNLGSRLKTERERLGFSQTDFAALAGASKHSQINWEKGAAAPNATVLAAWAAHGMDVLYVVTGQRSNRQTSTVMTELANNGHVSTGQSNAQTSAHMTETGDPVTIPAADVTHAAYRLSRREQALIENYRGSDDEGRRAVEVTASALAHKDGDQKKSKARE